MNLQGFFEAAMEFSFMGREFTINNAVIQAVIVFAVLMQALGWVFKHKIHILTCHVIATSLYATHWWLITNFTQRDASTSFYINVIGVIRLLIFISVELYVKCRISASLKVGDGKDGRKAKKSEYLTFAERQFFWMLIGAYLLTMIWRIIISLDAGTENMQSDIAGAVFATLASILYSTLFWKFPEKVMRMGQILVSILLMLQAWFLGSWVGIGEVAVLAMAISSIYRYDLDYYWRNFWLNCKKAKGAKDKTRKQFEEFTQSETHIQNEGGIVNV